MHTVSHPLSKGTGLQNTTVRPPARVPPVSRAPPMHALPAGKHAVSCLSTIHVNQGCPCTSNLYGVAAPVNLTARVSTLTHTCMWPLLAHKAPQQLQAKLRMSAKALSKVTQGTCWRCCMCALNCMKPGRLRSAACKHDCLLPSRRPPQPLLPAARWRADCTATHTPPGWCAWGQPCQSRSHPPPCQGGLHCWQC